MSAARLSHPRIVRIFDTGTDGGRYFIVMELFEGEDLGADPGAGPARAGSRPRGSSRAPSRGWATPTSRASSTAT